MSNKFAEAFSFSFAIPQIIKNEGEQLKGIHVTFFERPFTQLNVEDMKNEREEIMYLLFCKIMSTIILETFIL